MKAVCTAVLISAYLSYTALPAPQRPITVWQRVQYRHLTARCLDTARLETWNANYRALLAMNHTFGSQKNFISESSNTVSTYDLRRNNRKQPTGTGYIKNTSLFILAGREKLEFKILSKSRKLLIISDEAGTIDVYRNTGLAPDSLPGSSIAKYLLRSGVVFGKPIPYCQ